MNITMSTMQIRELCIKNDWFTCGDNSQYERLFERVKSKEEILNKLIVPARNERVELIRAMELIARTVNNIINGTDVDTFLVKQGLSKLIVQHRNGLKKHSVQNARFLFLPTLIQVIFIRTLL